MQFVCLCLCHAGIIVNPRAFRMSGMCGFGYVCFLICRYVHECLSLCHYTESPRFICCRGCRGKWSILAHDVPVQQKLVRRKNPTGTQKMDLIIVTQTDTHTFSAFKQQYWVTGCSQLSAANISVRRDTLMIKKCTECVCAEYISTVLNF